MTNIPYLKVSSKEKISRTRAPLS